MAVQVNPVLAGSLGGVQGAVGAGEGVLPGLSGRDVDRADAEGDGAGQGGAALGAQAFVGVADQVAQFSLGGGGRSVR
uniref:hypothetical protein n=1 Tax=Deinococcus sp. UR1 TaxID=1704277 RepID=UPI001F53097A|nr:hypothetical protein [Deinococcus sp. UR1]